MTIEELQEQLTSAIAERDTAIAERDTVKNEYEKKFKSNDKDKEKELDDEVVEYFKKRI